MARAVAREAARSRGVAAAVLKRQNFRADMRCPCGDSRVMASYAEQPTDDRRRRSPGVVAVHVVLARVILTGLNVSNVRQAVERTTDHRHPGRASTARRTRLRRTSGPRRPRKRRCGRQEGRAARRSSRPSQRSSVRQAADPGREGRRKRARRRSAGAALAGHRNAVRAAPATGAAAADGDFSGYTPARRIAKSPTANIARSWPATGIRSGSDRRDASRSTPTGSR